MVRVKELTADWSVVLRADSRLVRQRTAAAEPSVCLKINTTNEQLMKNRRKLAKKYLVCDQNVLLFTFRSINLGSNPLEQVQEATEDQKRDSPELWFASTPTSLLKS